VLSCGAAGYGLSPHRPLSIAHWNGTRKRHRDGGHAGLDPTTGEGQESVFDWRVGGRRLFFVEGSPSRGTSGRCCCTRADRSVRPVEASGLLERNDEYAQFGRDQLAEYDDSRHGHEAGHRLLMIEPYYAPRCPRSRRGRPGEADCIGVRRTYQHRQRESSTPPPPRMLSVRGEHCWRCARTPRLRP
jgi:hypothetical protein